MNNGGVERDIRGLNRSSTSTLTRFTEPPPSAAVNQMPELSRLWQEVRFFLFSAPSAPVTPNLYP